MLAKNVNTLYLLSGIPGSGKTTLAHELAKQHSAAVHSYDELPGANTKASMDGSVKREWIANAKKDIELGRSVVMDCLNITVEERLSLLKEFENYNCKKILIVKAVPLEVCLERNRNRAARLPDFVIEQAAEKAERPSNRENWDAVYFTN